MAVKPNKKGVVTGTKNNDKITWTNSSLWKKALTVNAGDGADVINFKKSTYKNNKLNGGNNNDVIYGGTNIDIIHGNNGDDKLYGYNGNDIISGDSGNDQIAGGKGNDKIYTGAGNDIVYFNKGDGADTLYKGSNSDTLQFNNFSNISALKKGLKLTKSGNNLVIKYTSKDSVTLSNYFKGGTSVTTLKSKDGKTIKFSDFYNSYIFNTYTGTKNKANKITGSALNDVIKGNNKNDTLNSGNGNDKVYGYAGNDTIKGGNGNDYIDGGDGNDFLYGDSGNDSIYGGNGNDNITGGTGNDIISGGAGSNYMYFYAGDGNDTVKAGTGTDTLVFKEGTNVSGRIIYDNKGVATVKITYGNNDSITLDNYQFGSDSRKYYQIGTVKKTISSLAGIGESVVLDASYSEYYGTKDSDRVIDNLAKQMYINTAGGNDYIEAYYDTVYAGDGDDTVKAEKSSIYGEAGNDNIINIGTQNAGSDRIIEISGGYDNDTITSQQYAQANNIRGDEGNDSIINYGTVVNDIYGGNGNDVINNGNSASVRNIYGEEGDDTITNSGMVTGSIQGGADNDSITNKGTVTGDILGEDGNDIITNEQGATVTNIDAGEGNNTVINSGTVSAITTGNNNDTIRNSGTVNNIIDNDGNNTITNSGTVNGSITINSTNAENTNTITNNGTITGSIETNLGQDTVTNDGLISENVVTSSGNDSITNNGTVSGYINAGVGNDIITTGADSSANYILFNKDDGSDILYLNAATNNLRFATGITDFNFEIQENNLVIKYNSDADSVTIINYTNNKDKVTMEYADGIIFKFNAFEESNFEDLEFNHDGTNLTITDKTDETKFMVVNNFNLSTPNTNIDSIICSDGIYSILSDAMIVHSNNGSIYNDMINYSNTTNTTITGGLGNDNISTNSNSTIRYIYGDGTTESVNDGNDNIFINGKVSYNVKGCGGNDTITVGSSGQMLNTSSDYGIYGGAGNDVITVENGGIAQYVYGDAGVDSITVSGNIIRADGGKGNDEIIIKESGQVSQADGGDGNDVIYVYGTVQDLYGGTGSDEITVASTGNVLSIHGDSDNIINCGNVSSIYGGRNGSTITNKGHANLISGGVGNDTIITELNSTANCIELKWGYGHDTLYLNSEKNVLYFDEPEISYSWSEDRKDLILSYSSRDSFTIKNFNYDNNSIYIKADEGNNAFLISNILYGIRGFEDVYFTDLTFSYNGENLTITDGNISKTVSFDMVYSSPLGTINNIYAKNENGNLKAFSLLNDALISIPSQTTGTKYNDKITITENIVTSSGGLGNDEIIIANSGVVQSVNGEDGNDVIAVNGTIGTIYTGQGNDNIIIHSTANIDNIQFSSGTGSSILNFVDSNLGDLIFNYKGNDLIIGYGENKSVAIKNYKTNTTKISKIVAQDGEGSVIELAPKEVYITPNNHPRRVSVDNDIALNIYFGEGVTVYDSYDSNYSIGIPANERWIYYTYLNEDNVKVTDSFIITNVSDNSIIKFIYSDDSYHYITTNFSNNYLTGSNNNDLIVDTRDKHLIKTGDGDDVIYGLYGADNINISGSGTKTIKITREDQSGNDVVTFSAKPDALNIEIEEGMVYSTQQNGNDLVITFADYSWDDDESDIRTLTLKNLYSSEYAPDIEDVHIYSKSHGFARGDIITTWYDSNSDMGYPPGLVDWLNSNDDNMDGLWGIPSNKTGVNKFIIESYDGSYDEENIATYTFRTGDGVHTIYSGTGKTSYDPDKNIVDVIKFETELPLSYSMSDNGKDLIVHYGEGDAVIIKDYYILTSSHTVQTIINGEDTIGISDIIGTNFNCIVGTDDDDSFSYNYPPYDGYIILNGGNDTISYYSGKYNNYINSGSGDDYISVSYGAGLIDLGEGDDGLYLVSGKYTILAGDGNDNLTIGNYTCDVYAGKGDDYIKNSDNMGGKHNLYFNTGDGTDTIVFTAPNKRDFVQLVLNDVTCYSSERVDDSLVINYGNNDKIIVSGFYSRTSQEKIILKTMDGKAHYFDDDINGTNNNDILYGTNSKDIIYGYYGNDTIYAYGGNDIICSGYGSNIIYAGDGNDTVYLESSSCNNYVDGGDGADTLTSVSATDSLYGGAGNDSLNGSYGYLNGGLGNDNYSIYTINPCTIEDASESGSIDSLKIFAEYSDMKLFMNIVVDTDGNIISGDDLFISSNEYFGNIENSIRIIDQFANDKGIEKFESTWQVRYSTSEILNEIRQSAASWIADSGYTSAQDIIDTKDADLISALQAQFNDAVWQDHI